MRLAELDTLISQSREGKAEATAALVLGLYRELRVFIATYAANPAMLDELAPAAWSAARQELLDAQSNHGLRLGQAGDGTTARALIERLQKCARPLLSERLTACCQQAQQAQDALLGVIARSGLEQLSVGGVAVDVAQAVRDRSKRMPPSAIGMLSKRYADGRSVAEIAKAQGMPEADIASALFMARSSADWQASGLVHVDPGNQQFPLQIESYLAGTIADAERGELAESLMADLGRSATFERELRLHLVLTALLGRDAPGDAEKLLAALRTAPASRRMRAVATDAAVGETRAIVRNTTGSLRAVRPPGHAGAGKKSAGMLWALGGGVALLGAVVVLLTLSRSPPAKTEPAATAPTAAAPLGNVPQPTPTSTPTSGATAPGAPLADGNTPEVGRLGRGDGNVYIRKDGALFPGQLASVIRSGQGLEVNGATSSTMLALGDFGQAKLLGNTFVTSIQPVGGVTTGLEIALNKGRLEIELAAHTPARTLAVRWAGHQFAAEDAAFTLNGGDGEAELEVSRGSVHLRRAGGQAAIDILGKQTAAIDGKGRVAIRSTGQLLRAIDLAGPTATFDGRRWMSHALAVSGGLTVAPGCEMVSGKPVADPTLDNPAKVVLGSGLVSSAPIHCTQTLPNGDYDVELLVAGEPGIGGEKIAARVNGTEMSAPADGADDRSWRRLGAYRIQVKDRSLDLVVACAPTTRLAGLAIFSVGASDGGMPPLLAIVAPNDRLRAFNDPGPMIEVDAFAPLSPVAKVEFFADDRKLGESGAAPFAFRWAKPAPGDYRLSAKLTDQAGASATSATVPCTIGEGGNTGAIAIEYWTGIGGDEIDKLTSRPEFPDHPNHKDRLTALTFLNFDQNLGTRMLGYLYPPEDGNYLFAIACDDTGELWLSSDADPAHKVRIAYNPRAENPGDFNAHPEQRSKPIALTAGQRCYLEILHKQGGGGNHMLVAWQLPSGSWEKPIPGNRLSPFEGPSQPAAVAAAKPPVEAAPLPPRFIKGINFGGEAVTIDGNRWQSQKQAEGDPATPAAVYVSDLELVKADSGLGPVEKDMSNGDRNAGDGRPLSIRGTPYAKGLGVHSPSEIIVDLKGQYARFESDVGTDDESNGNISFEVWADGSKLFDSGLMTVKMPAKPVSVEVAGRNQLRLVVTDGGDGPNGDHGDWAGARLIRQERLMVKNARRVSSAMLPKPAGDADLKAMLNAGLAAKGDGFALSQPLPPGRYQVWFWVMENVATNSRQFDLEVEGEPLTGLGLLPLGGWAKYGPCTVTFKDGALDVTVKPKKGTPQLMGMAIFKEDQPAVSIAKDGAGWTITGATYVASVTGEGYMSNLKVGGVEFFRPGIDISKGSYFHNGNPVPLPNIEKTSATTLVTRSDQASITYDFSPDSFTMTLANAQPRELKFYIIVDPAAKAAQSPQGQFVRTAVNGNWPSGTWYRDGSRLQIGNCTRQWVWAAGSQVVEALLNNNETRVLTIKAGASTPEELKQVADATR